MSLKKCLIIKWERSEGKVIRQRDYFYSLHKGKQIFTSDNIQISILLRLDKYVRQMLIVYSNRHLDRLIYLGEENETNQ